MINARTLMRRLAGGLIAGQLMLGAISIGALVSSSPSSAATLMSPHGVWQGIVSSGQMAYGAMTKMDKGGTIAFVVKGDTLSLVLSHPDWDLRTDGSMRARVQIDGATYTGTAVVDDRDMIEIENVSSDVLKMFVDGSQAVVDLADGAVVWRLDLDGFTASILEARKYYKLSY
jgi:hypothetical protein